MAARRVLVTDSDERSALAACRGLAAAGFDVTAGVSVRPSPGGWSRSVRRRVRLPEPRLDEAAFVAALERELRKQPHDALLCATEAAALAVSAQRDRVEGLCRHGLPSHDVLERCLEKGELLEIAAAAGLDAPPSSLCESAEEAQRAAARFGFPAMVKPHRSLTGFGTSRAHASSVDIESPEALADAAGANLAAIWCDRLLDGGAATTAARAGVRYRFDDAEARNALFALRRGRLREFLGICRPRARVTHAYFRWSDRGPFAGRV